MGARRTLQASIVGALLGAGLIASSARANDTVIVGAVGSSSANAWPVYIGVKKGFFAAEGLDIDFVYAQSNAAVIQQLTAGSTNVATNAGLVDPIRAIDKGAPIALVRIEIQAPPYALMAKPGIRRIADLKGKTIMVGGAKDITRLFADRMLAPNGVAAGDFDYVFAGATNARFSALQSGAVDAALLTAPFNFYAESAGFSNLGFAFDYVKDMPFAGMAVNRAWASAHPQLAEKFVRVFVKNVAWFEDEANRAEAVDLMVVFSRLKREDVERAYDFLRAKHLFEPTGKVSRAKLKTVVDALRALGDIGDLPVDRLILSGLTQMTD
jgi:NitT/TauT family transport system substrate-binding protein